MKLESYKYGILWKSYICQFIFLWSNTSTGKYVLFSLYKQVGTCTSNPVSISIYKSTGLQTVSKQIYYNSK